MTNFYRVLDSEDDAFLREFEGLVDDTPGFQSFTVGRENLLRLLSLAREGPVDPVMAVRAAIDAIEEAGASPRLTDAVVHCAAALRALEMREAA